MKTRCNNGCAAHTPHYAPINVKPQGGGGGGQAYVGI